MGSSVRRRIVFMGSDPIALPGLEFLAGEAADRVEIAGVFTQPDRPVGRGKKVQGNAIKQWAFARGLEVRQPERLGPSDLQWLEEKKCELLLVMAYGHILRKSLLEFPRFGTYNLHASLLPKYRGASPIQAALASGDRQTGVTLMRMVQRLDAGQMVDREGFLVDRLETGETAEARMAEACVPLLARNLEGLLSGEVLLAEQDDGEATYCRKLEKKDGELDFSASAETLARRINALYPWPGCVIEFREQRVKIGLAEWDAETASEEPGTVVGADEKGLRIATGAGVLSLLSLQRPGGRMLSALEFLRGFPIPVGTRLASGSMPEFVAPTPFPYVRRSQGSG